MPKVRRSKHPPPEGWELIEPTLDELEQKMREGKTQFFDTAQNFKLQKTETSMRCKNKMMYFISMVHICCIISKRMRRWYKLLSSNPIINLCSALVVLQFQLKPNRTKENANRNRCGPFSKYTTKNLGTFTTCSTAGKPSVGNCTTFAWMKISPTGTWLPNGRSLDTKTCAAWDVFKRGTQISARTASVGCRKENWKRWDYRDNWTLLISTIVFKCRNVDPFLLQGRIVECVHCGCRGCSG